MAPLSTLLGRVRRRWLATVALRTAGFAAAAAAVPAAAAILVDLMVAPEGTPLMLLAASGVLLSVTAAILVIARVERRADDTRVARFVEERAATIPGVGSLDDAVVSAVEAAQGPPERAAFTELVVSAAVRRLDGVTPASIVPPLELRRAGVIAVAGVAILSAVVFAGLPSLSRAIETARLRLFPASISVEVVPGDTRIVAGRPLTIRASVSSNSGQLKHLQPQLVVSAGEEQRTVAMTKAGDAFEFLFESVDRSFRYQVSAGSVASASYSVTALFPPQVSKIDLHYTYPSFSGLAAREEEDGGDIYAPAGTRVRVRIHTDKPIVSGQLAMASGAVALRNSGDRTVDAQLVLVRDDSYRVRLADRDGLTSDGDSEYFIRLMDDRPPAVRVVRPSMDQGISPLEEVTIEARADDDYGVSSLELVYSVGGGKEHVVPFTNLTGTPIQKTGSHLLAAEELKVRPGDVITYYARARDVGRGKAPTETRSDMFFLEVKPFSEEFVAAQSQAGGGASGDPQLDSLISAQKEIISATWNIERRAQAGRSPEDIAAIARAQTELKARVERLLGASRGRRGRDPMPQQITPQGQPPRPRPSEGVSAAIEAMARAIEQLGTQRTRDAIPHEMAALNGLLQAQAEVRRRQVMQQANASGSGSGNRSGQDLSALFDKELQRQQRTNYEQRSQVESRPEQRQPDEALDKIRDLARRQEELNRRQQELARMSAEERTRELEKLSRDQQELRRQAEELARQNGRQPGLRDAAEQMGAAAGNMRREDAEGARQSGQRAADQLRRAEEQMRGADPDAQRRAAAELQSQAQQIAQEQRRIASEASRLEKSGQGDAEARRRLASEKERLADRVEELRRAAQQAGRDPKSQQSAAARQAAADLERQRVAERMRESAQQTRGGKPDGKEQRANADEQIARALDQVVEKLGGTASADAQKLSQELERTKQLREKLDGLEKQMKQAQQAKNQTEAARLQQQYEQEMRRARESLGRAEGPPREGQGNSTPERHEFSQSAPGTEQFKQDRSGWESLRNDVNRAIERHESAVSRRLAGKITEARLNAGGSDRVPDEYRQFVAKYYESLARSRK